MQQYQKTAIVKDLRKKMVLLADLRQTGKTTLAKDIGQSLDSTVYLNYDSEGGMLQTINLSITSSFFVLSSIVLCCHGLISSGQNLDNAITRYWKYTGEQVG